jgi:hypothetical protein
MNRLLPSLPRLVRPAAAAVPAPALGRALARHWPALAGAALVAALAPAGAGALTSLGATFFLTANETAVSAHNQFGPSPAILATGSSGAGLKATGGTGVEAQGAQTGVQAAGATGVVATGAQTGVDATGAQTGIAARSNSGTAVNALGGRFAGGKAPIRLVPALTPGAPTAGAHEVGELYVDSQGRLFICTGAGGPGTWALVGLQTLPAAETP